MKEIRLNIPQKMIDLNADQLLYISDLFASGYTEREFLTKAFIFLTEIRIVPYLTPPNPDDVVLTHKKSEPFIMTAEQLALLSEKCRFLLTPDEVKPIKKFNRFAFARHYRLYNTNFEEYLMAENYYFAFTHTQDVEHLDNLISVLYRYPWQRWNSEKIQKRSQKFANLSPEEKYSVFLWYAGFRNYVSKRCKTLFSNKGGGSDTAFNPRNYINGMIHQLTNADVTARSKLLKTPTMAALDELEQRAIEAEKTEEQMKKNRPKNARK